MTTKTAYDLILAHWDGNLPVNVEAIARQIGIQVIPAFGMEGGESGRISRGHDDSYVIEYDASQARVRQRFTVAHELGHFALGHLERGQREFRDKPEHFMSQVAQPREAAANNFAAKLLMPERILKYVIEEKRVTDVPSLANIFDVSKAAMTYRLRNLGIVT